MPAPLGAEVGLYYDAQRVVRADDYIQTPTGRTYHVRSVRAQERGLHTGRKHIRAVVVAPSDVEPGATIHPLVWYRRG